MSIIPHFCAFKEQRGIRMFWSFWVNAKRNVEPISIEAYYFTGWPHVGIKTLHGKWTLSLALCLFSIYFSIPAKYNDYGKDREIDLSFYGGRLHWAFWTDPLSWSSKTPKWRNGGIDFIDLLLGKRKCTHTTIEKRDVLIPMPEKAYPATAELQQWEWKRPRWPAMRHKRVHIDIPGGIPFAGKGENSWDCGDDATSSMTTGKCDSIPDGIGALVVSMLKTRIKNGGWGDFNWKREEAA